VGQVNLAVVMVLAEAERVAQAALRGELLMTLLVALEFPHLYLAHKFNTLAAAAADWHLTPY
jgi:hypothetical protein